MIRAVIFDMDGTLFDTEAVYGRGWHAAGLTTGQYHQMIGRSRIVNDRTLVTWGMVPAEVRRVRNEYIQNELETNGIPVKPGAKEALIFLQEMGIPAAVATSSPLETAQTYLEHTGLGHYFARVLSGYGLEHGKPEPDIFLLAAKELSEEPDCCMVVEDSYNGVRAGRRAGMVTVMVPDQIPPDDEMHRIADVILDSLYELPEYIARCNA